ncbi:TetR/AcrR family transcriptional regulator [Mycobacterium sherrisii]|uniref:TetR/AcrR family transcriptional regulator n=1 Tax=Mycobacterium sherrisii TaxID=243061 RepID=UPI002DDDB16A|nr:TetR/AcrR family transcriptional regulator [Mycobacterium sherrisii]MEC4761659.1 TetR/AcrR family transcriptional regulator [Mycobacterium sherrisii]
MEVFWRDGFEGASTETLRCAMGIRHAASFYRAFGDKRNLFFLAVEHYAATVGSAPIAALSQGKTADEAVAAMLASGAQLYTEKSSGIGCLIVSGAVNCTPENADVAEFLAAYRVTIQKKLVERLERAVADGELSRHTNIGAVAEFYASLLHGIAVRARDGAPGADLRAAVALAPRVSQLSACPADNFDTRSD